MAGLDSISVVTVCRGRYRALEQTVSSWQEAVLRSIVVVESRCPDDAKEKIAAKWPDVLVVKDNAPQFSLARLCNIGAKTTSAPWLLFLDAEVLLTEKASGVLETFTVKGKENSFACICRRERLAIPGCGGILLCPAAAFQRVEGYDEMFVAYGCEDSDLIGRLQLAGYQRKEIPWDAVRHLPHPRPYDDRERKRLWNVNDAYAAMKFWHLLLIRPNTRGDTTSVGRQKTGRNSRNNASMEKNCWMNLLGWRRNTACLIASVRNSPPAFLSCFFPSAD